MSWRDSDGRKWGALCYEIAACDTVQPTCSQNTGLANWLALVEIYFLYSRQIWADKRRQGEHGETGGRGGGQGPLPLPGVPPHQRWARDNTSATMLLRQRCRDNVTMFLGPKMVEYCIMSLFAAVTPFRHQVLDIFRIFSCPCSSITLLRS